MELAKKIFSVILIILGSIVIVVSLLTAISDKVPESADTPFLIGYYLGFVLIIILGVVLIMTGVRIRKKIREKKLKKDLLNSLPGDES